jgi:hypothetical protein
VVKATHRPLHHQDSDPVPTLQEAGWFPGPVWTGVEIFAMMYTRLIDTRCPSVAAMTHKIIKTGARNFGSRFRVTTIYAAPETVKIGTWDPGRAQGMRSDST